MIALVSAILGFFTSALPQAVKLYQTKLDYAHELEMMKLQVEANKILGAQRMGEAAIEADNAQMSHIYTTQVIGIGWIDGLNALIRPMLTIFFFWLYCYVKIISFNAIMTLNAPFTVVVATLWGQEDIAIFAAIIGYYFGNRTFTKIFDSGFSKRNY